MSSDGLLGWMTPESAIAIDGIGSMLRQLGRGDPVDASPAMNALLSRQQSAQQRRMLEESGVLNRLSPDQRAIIAQMPPEAATQFLAQIMFREPAAPKVTDDMTEYEYARSQGYGGSFQDWMIDNRRAGATQVNVGPTGVDYGAPPKDMAWLRNPDGTVRLDDRGAPMAVVVSGSPTDQDRVKSIADMAGQAIEGAEAEAAAAETTMRTGSVVLEDIERVRDKIEDSPWYQPTAGFFGSILSNVAGTEAADVKALTTTIRANIGFDRLQAMRDASPTGGALGNVTVQELERLESVLGSLSQSQGEEQLLENIDRLNRIYSDIMRKAAAYPNAAEFGFAVDIKDDPLGLRK